MAAAAVVVAFAAVVGLFVAASSKSVVVAAVAFEGVTVLGVAVVVQAPFSDQDEFVVAESDPLARDAGFDLAEEAAVVVVASSSSSAVAALDFVVAVEPSFEAAVAFASTVVEVAAESFADQAEAVAVVLPEATLVIDPSRPELLLALGELSVFCSCDR